MSNAVILASYTIRLRNKRSNDKLILNEGNGGISLVDVLIDFLTGLQGKHSHDAESKQVFKVIRLDREVHKDDSISLFGVMTCGRYGVSSSIVDSETMEIAYSRKATDAQLLPFYFMFYMTPDSTRAIMILQRIGTQGIYSALSDTFRGYLSIKQPNVLLETSSHAPKEVIEHFRKGKVKSITFTGKRASSDVYDMMQLNDDMSKDIVVTQIIKAKGKRDLGKIPFIENALNNLGNVLERKIESEDEPQIKINVQYNKKERSIGLSEGINIAPYIDVTSDVRVDANGHPIFDDLYLCASVLSIDLSREIRN